MKKIILLSFLMIIMVQCFAGGTGEATEGKVQLDLLYWDTQQQAVVDAQIAEFEAEHPSITVNASIAPWAEYWQKLQTTVVARNAPDLFWMNVPNFAKYVEGKHLLNIQEYIDRDSFDISPYQRDLVSKYSYEGDIYILPENYDTVGLFYNKKLFDEAGLAYPDESWDWNRMLEAAKTLTLREGDEIVQYGFAALRANQDGFYNFILSNGGGILNDDNTASLFNRPASIEAVQFLLDTMYKHEVSPDGMVQAETNGQNLFKAGLVAMVTGGSWRVPSMYEALGEDVAVAPLPVSPRTGERKNVIHGIGFAAYRHTKHPEAAWSLLKSFYSRSFNSKLAEAAIQIPAYAGLENTWVNVYPSMNLEVFIDASTYAVPYPASKNTAEWMAIEAAEIADAWLGKQDAATALGKIHQGTMDVLKAEQE